MGFTTLAGLGGMTFVLMLAVLNYMYVRVGVLFPTSDKDLDAVTDSFARLGSAFKRMSVIVPVAWVSTTIFAAGLLSTLWRGGTGTTAWALVGFAGVLMQNAVFMCAEALRFGMVAAARHGRTAMGGLWGLSNVLVGFNQVFLALAILGFTTAGVGAGVIATWHAWLGYISAAVLFIAASASPYNVDGGNRLWQAGLIGAFGWGIWIATWSVTLLRL
ncbi:hypothetical protein [Nonomuraea sp. KM88]|uniref:hypothetical protein n=1 Tax=Nonomuraea sp. KM88 TaxID=3457427 RepID=UPI003FCE0A76